MGGASGVQQWPLGIRFRGRVRADKRRVRGYLADFPWCCRKSRREMKEIRGGSAADDVSKPEVRRRGRRRKGGPLTLGKIDWSHGMEN